MATPMKIRLTSTLVYRIVFNVLRDLSLWERAADCRRLAHHTTMHKTGSGFAPAMWVDSERIMWVLRSKLRVVTFQAYSEDYTVLARACRGSGARSLSEFACTAILRRIDALSAPRLTIPRLAKESTGYSLQYVLDGLREASTPVSTGPRRALLPGAWIWPYLIGRERFIPRPPMEKVDWSPFERRESFRGQS